MEKWHGKVAVVTGASAGIGKDISIKLTDYGIKVIGCGRNLEKLLDIKNNIKECKGDFVPFQCDITKEDDVLKLFNFVNSEYHELSILINNAGMAFDGSVLFGKTENWKQMLDTNLLGLCMCTREAYSIMSKNDKSVDKSVPSHIINICGVAGHSVLPRSLFHFYSATKFAVNAVSESIRLELRDLNSDIKITQISPGLVETEFLIRTGGEELLANAKLVTPEPLQAVDISEAIIFALSTPNRSCVNQITVRPTCQPH